MRSARSWPLLARAPARAERGSVLAIHGLGGRVEERAPGERVDLALAGGAGGLREAQQGLQEEAVRAAKEPLQPRWRDRPCRVEPGHGESGRNVAEEPVHGAGRQRVAQGLHAAEVEGAAAAPARGKVHRAGGDRVLPRGLAEGGRAPEAQGRRPRGREGVAPQGNRIRDVAAALAGRKVGAGERGARLDEHRRRLPLGALHVEASHREGDPVLGSADDAVQGVELGERPVGGGGRPEGRPARPARPQAAPQRVRQDGVLARHGRQVAFGEADHADRAEREAGRLAHAADGDGRLAEAADGRAEREERLLHQPERVVSREGAAARVGGDAGQALAEDRGDAGSLARLEQPRVEEVAERRPERAERSSRHDQPRHLHQRLDGRARGPEVPERPLDVARAPGHHRAVRVVLGGARLLELCGERRFPGGEPGRPFERALRASRVPASGAERPDELHRRAVGQVPVALAHRPERRQHVRKSLTGEIGSQAAHHGEDARPGREADQRQPARHAHRQRPAGPGQPGQAVGQELRDWIERRHEHGDLLQRDAVHHLPRHPVGGGLDLLLEAGMLLEVHGAVGPPLRGRAGSARSAGGSRK